MSMSYSTFVNWSHSVGMKMASEFAMQYVPYAQVQMWMARYNTEQGIALKNGGHYGIRKQGS